MNNEKVILFDLGGVLIELGESAFPAHWFESKRNFESLDWFKSETAQLFELGLISANEFAKAIKNDLAFSASADEICSEFTKWPIGPYEGTFDLLNALKEKYTLAALTNTNELHWPRIIGECGIPNYCEHIFASHILKLAKPDAAIYEYVLAALDVSAESVIFFDDNVTNVQAAQDLGIQGYLVKGHDELRNKILELGLLY